MITKEKTEQIEQNNVLKSEYIKAGAWGQNKWVYLPTLLIFSSLMSFWVLYEIKLLLSIYTIIPIAIIITSAYFIKLIQAKVVAKYEGIIHTVPVSIAKKIYGNDNTEVYYVIFTDGNKRHDIEFIEHIANKIFNIDNIDVDKKIKNKIDNLFGEKIAQLSAQSILLPLEFTENEKVYQRQYNLKHLSQTYKNIINENKEKFIVIPFNDISVPMLKEKDYTFL